jgi:sigma-B regulation protein RsbU (phosphoserine phosphatase)
VADENLIQKAFSDYQKSPDVLALVAEDAQGKRLATFGQPPEASGALFGSPPGAVRTEDRYLVAWAPSVIEGNVVGRVAVVVSTARLEAGERLRRHILGVAGLGAVLALGISLFFVNFYLGPLISLTHQGLRTAREMEIAKRIQTSILPSTMKVPGLDIGATMIPATEVGGDYYDVIPDEEGCWVAIGDVAGHGVQAGLVMMMVQSVVSGLLKRQRNVQPRSILEVLNEVLYENIRHRLGSDEHVTFTLLRIQPDGRVVFSGAHEEIVILRAATGRCERVATRGPWLGAVRSIARGLADDSLTLHPGDALVLHTDGVTEATDLRGEQFGIERLVQAVERASTASAEGLRGAIVDAVSRWMHVQDDDVTVLVVKYDGTRSAG